MKKIDYDLGEGIIAFTTLKESDGCAGKYSGFNTCDYVKDSPDSVILCQKRLADELDIYITDLIIPLQTHSAKAEIVDRFISHGSEELDSVDALVTDLPGKALIVHTADCLPVLLADPVAKVVAVAHGGWKGLVAGILENTVADMINVGAKPARIVAQFGPYIMPDDYKVGEEILKNFSPDEIISKPEGYFIDLARVAKNHLKRVGVRDENIRDSRLSTFTDAERFYSARRDGKETGRMATVIMIKP